MATLSTHVLDTARGRPAAGIPIAVFTIDGDARRHLASATTNADGRTDAPLATDLAAGEYELEFDVAAYVRAEGAPAFFDTIPIRFRIDDAGARYHVPLLLSPWGYSTYRGS